MNIGLSSEDRESIRQILLPLLADETVLYFKTRNFHWNVKGPNFIQLHKFFEEQYDAIDDSIDDIAEKIRTYGFPVQASLKELSELARLSESFLNPNKTADEMLIELVDNHEQIVRILRSDLEMAQTKFNDSGIADYLTGLMQYHEKAAWLLRSHLQ